MPDISFENIFDNKHYQAQSQQGKQEIEDEMIVDDQLGLHQVLDEVREVLYRHRPKACRESYDRTEQHQELLVRQVFCLPALKFVDQGIRVFGHCKRNYGQDLTGF